MYCSTGVTFRDIRINCLLQYTVKAANLAGEAESTAVLKMCQIAPTFGKALDRSLDVSEGEPLELKAKVDGSPIPAVKWFVFSLINFTLYVRSK